MSDKVNNIIAGIILVFIPFVFFFGIYCWKHPVFDSISDLKKLYYLCIASVMYMISFVTFLLANPKWLKILSSSVSSIFAVNLYQEVVIGAKAWTEFDYWLIIITAANYFLLYVVIDKLKIKK